MSTPGNLGRAFGQIGHNPTRCGLLYPTVMGYRAIFFDLDGTLTDHRHAASLAAVQWASELGMDVATQKQRDRVLSRWFTIEDRWFQAYERGEITHLDQRRFRAREFTHQPNLSDDQAEDVFQHFLHLYLSAQIAYPDARDALDRAIKAAPLVGITTNGAPDMQKAKLANTGLWSDDLVMLASAELGVAKPSPTYFTRVLETLNITDPSQCLVIGDNKVNDVDAARLAGFNAIWLVRHATATMRQPFITTLDDVVFTPT